MGDQPNDSKPRIEDDPEFVDRVKLVDQYIGMAMMDEQQAEREAESERGPGRHRSGPRRLSVFGLSMVMLVLLVLLLYVVGTRGTDPTRWLATPEPAASGRSTAPATGGQGTQQSTGASTVGHDENAADHVQQGSTPLPVDAGEWQVALARNKVLVETWSDVGGEPKPGNRAIGVDVYVTNKGTEDRTIDKSFFSLVDGAGTSYPILGLESQEARSGNPVSLETWYEVPEGTQGLSLHFAPPASAGGAPVDLALPELRY